MMLTVEMGEPFVRSDLEFVLTVLDDVDCAVEMVNRLCGVIWSLFSLFLMMLSVEMGEPFVWNDLEFVVLTVLDDVDC